MSELVKHRTLTQKISGYRDIWRYHRGKTVDFARHDYEVFTTLNDRIRKYINSTDDKLKVLDIGCGQRFPNTLLFGNRGDCEAIGIDSDIVGPGLAKYAKMAFVNGLERTLKSAVREILFDRIYFANLEQFAGMKLSKKKLTIFNHSTTRLPFEDNYFDLIISNAVFEHIRDVPGAIRELTRISKPAGILYNVIHLYPSLSGGHNLQWAFPEKSVPHDVPAWDHLRQNKCPTHIYLNKYRESDYRKYFEEYTHILDWLDGAFEGRGLLTPEIRADLPDYSEADLLKRDIIVISRPA